MEKERKSKIYWERGPGSGAYVLPPLLGFKFHGLTHKRDPAYTLNKRLQHPYDIPGPGTGRYYLYDGINHYGPKPEIAFTIRKKLPLTMETVGPGPSLNPYIGFVKNRAPAFSLRTKRPVNDNTIGPGAGAYNLPPAIGPKIPDKLAAAEITIKGRRKSPLDDEPRKRYFLQPPVSTRKYRILEKWPSVKETIEAGPASYNPLKQKCTGFPSWKFGIKHGDYTGFFRTPCDAVDWSDVHNW